MNFSTKHENEFRTISSKVLFCRSEHSGLNYNSTPSLSPR